MNFIFCSLFPKPEAAEMSDFMKYPVSLGISLSVRCGNTALDPPV